MPIDSFAHCAHRIKELTSNNCEVFYTQPSYHLFSQVYPIQALASVPLAIYGKRQFTTFPDLPLSTETGMPDQIQVGVALNR